MGRQVKECPVSNQIIAVMVGVLLALFIAYVLVQVL